MEKRIDLEKFQEWWENANDPDMGELEDIIHGYPIMLRELKRMYEKEDDIIEYVGYLLATPDVLEQLMGAPSQIHTINNLTGSLEKLLDILKDNASE